MESRNCEICWFQPRISLSLSRYFVGKKKKTDYFKCYHKIESVQQLQGEIRDIHCVCIHVLPALKMDICIHLSHFLIPIMCLALSSWRWATGSFYLKITYCLGSMCICLFNIGESKKVFISKGNIFKNCEGKSVSTIYRIGSIQEMGHYSIYC